MKTLFINACIRKESRTLKIAKVVLQNVGGDVEEVCLEKENLRPLNEKTLKERDLLIARQEFNNDFFKYAQYFAEADTIIIATPYYDLSFSALLKDYIENINVVGITFGYDEKGNPYSLCKAQRLIYITTAGGKIVSDEFGYGYIKSLCDNFYGIKDVQYIKVECLDMDGMNPQEVINGVIANLK